MNKIIIIVGPTASGKSELAVALAKKFNGEIISCDSRQIYRGLNLGTGKVPGVWKKVQNPKSLIFKSLNFQFYYKSIPHHLIDFVSPKRQYSVSRFKKAADKAITDILKRGKLPILCGGSMHYIDAVVFNQSIPEVKPNPKLRKELEKLSTEELFARIVRLDPERAKTIDRYNRRRLIRALEIIATTGKPVPVISAQSSVLSKYDTLWIGTILPQKTLYEKIDKRLKQRIKDGMIQEVQNLHKGFRAVPRKIPRRSALSWKRLEQFGLEYRYIAKFLQQYPDINISSPLRREVRRVWNIAQTELSYAIKHYSKRQLTWWKKNQEIHWIKPNIKTAEKLIKKFIH